MAGVAASEPRKLPVWATVHACYATVLRNFGQLVRISWLWLLIVLPLGIVAIWLIWPEGRGAGTMAEIIVWVAELIHLPAFASIAVAWHRLILHGERVGGTFYLRLDRTVWRYTLALAVAFVVTNVLIYAPDLLVARYPLLLLELNLQSLLVGAGALGVAIAMALLVLRISLVLPGIARGESLSPMNVWRASRGNTTPLLKASLICLAPLAILGTALELADRNSRATAVLVFTAFEIVRLLLFITWMALWSMLYRRLVLQGADMASPTPPRT